MNIREVHYGDFILGAKYPGADLRYVQGILDTNIMGLFAPEKDIETFVEPETHGVVVERQFYRERNLAIKFELLSQYQSSFMQLARSMAVNSNIIDNPLQTVKFVTTDISNEAEFPDGKEFIVRAVNSNLTMDGSSRSVQTYKPFTLQLMCPDYRIYENKERTQEILLESDQGGAVLDFVLPVLLEESEAGILEFNVLGDFPTHPTVRIRGPLVTPSLINTTNGAVFTYSANINAGQYIDVDFYNKTVTNHLGNDVNNNVSPASRGMIQWVLEPGINRVTLSHQGDSNAQAGAVLTYKHACITTSI